MSSGRFWSHCRGSNGEALALPAAGQGGAPGDDGGPWAVQFLNSKNDWGTFLVPPLGLNGVARDYADKRFPGVRPSCHQGASAR